MNRRFRPGRQRQPSRPQCGEQRVDIVAQHHCRTTAGTTLALRQREMHLVAAARQPGIDRCLLGPGEIEPEVQHTGMKGDRLRHIADDQDRYQHRSIPFPRATRCASSRGRAGSEGELDERTMPQRVAMGQGQICCPENMLWHRRPNRITCVTHLNAPETTLDSSSRTARRPAWQRRPRRLPPRPRHLWC